MNLMFSRLVFLGALAWAALPAGALAGGPCDRIRTQIAAVLLAQPPYGDLQAGASAFPGADNCQLARTSSGPLAICQWSFGYRTAPAQAQFERLDQEAAACLGRGAALPKDAAVNHPDSYTLRAYRAGGAIFAVSIKDKGALGRTLVFSRVYRAPGG